MKPDKINVLKYVKNLTEFTWNSFTRIEEIPLETMKQKLESGKLCMGERQQHPSRPRIIGFKTWFKNGKWHRENNLPAAISNNDSRKFHCLDGDIINLA